MENVSIHFIHAKFIHELNNARIYFSEFEKRIEEIKYEANARLEELSKKSEEIPEEYTDEYVEQLHTAENILERNLVNSIVISLYAIIEITMNEICSNLKEYKKYELSHKDLRGEGMERSVLYLNKVCKLSITQQDKEFLNGFNSIRNLIVHASGNMIKIEKSKLVEKIKNYSKRAPGIVVERTEIIINKDFIEYIFNQCQSVFKNIFNQIP